MVKTKLSEAEKPRMSDAPGAGKVASTQTEILRRRW